MRGQRAAPLDCAGCRRRLGLIHGRREVELSPAVVSAVRVLGGWRLGCGHCGHGTVWYGKIRG